MSSEVRLFAGDDPAMQEAFRNARANFKYFWREVTWERQRIIPGLMMANIKIQFADPPAVAASHGQGAEHMWIGDIEFDGKYVYGTLLNQPNWLKSFNEGQPVKMGATRISDWMYVLGTGEVYGAFTVNLLRAHMGRGERRQHDEAWGLDFGDAKDIRIIPEDWEGAGGKKKGFFGKLFGGSKAPVDLQSIEHPMAMHMAESLGDFFQSNPSEMNSPDDKGWTLLHRMAAAGSTACVQKLLQFGADKNAKSEEGLTPLQLAKGLGWRDVTRLLMA